MILGLYPHPHQQRSKAVIPLLTRKLYLNPITRRLSLATNDDETTAGTVVMGTSGAGNYPRQLSSASAICRVSYREKDPRDLEVSHVPHPTNANNRRRRRLHWWLPYGSAADFTVFARFLSTLTLGPTTDKTRTNEKVDPEKCHAAAPFPILSIPTAAHTRRHHSCNPEGSSPSAVGVNHPPTDPPVDSVLVLFAHNAPNYPRFNYTP